MTNPVRNLLRNSGAPLTLCYALAVAILISGCASSKWVELRETPHNPLSEKLKLLSTGGPEPTRRTMQLLRRYDLQDDLKGDRGELLVKLNEIAAREPSPAIVYAVSELAYLGGKRAELTNKKEALDLYGAAVLHAYLYLFDPSISATHNPYDTQFRGACDLYNASLEGTMRIVRSQGTLRPGHACTIQTASRQVDVSVVIRSSSWHADDFDRFEFASDYEINGLKNHHHAYGLGVPLIAIRKQHENQHSGEEYYPPKLAFPVTAFLRIEPEYSTTENPANGNPAKRPNTPTRLHAILELYDPLATSTLEVEGRQVPLEVDLSTPLAYFLSQPDFDDNRLSTMGLLFPDSAKELQGLYMLEPFQPDKIPVVMVHGLWSSPVTWMEMFNDLRSSPEIRQNYQFWFYLYPSGQPFWFSGAQMREDLARARHTLDPHHAYPALDQSVLVGHSMGGLVSKLQTVDSGNRFWQTVSSKPIEAVSATPETRNSLAHTLFFQPNPSVRRVITIGTPHRGSQFANGATRWIGSKLISIPSKIVNNRQKLLRDNPGVFYEDTLLEINTSIDSLAPDSPLLPILLTADHAPWTTYHNIVGRIPAEGFFGKVASEGDGVVELASAQLDETQVASQVLVPADHVNIHRHPRAILEVRRILLEHLQQLRAPTGMVTPAAGTQRPERLPLPTATPNSASQRSNSTLFAPPL